MNNDIISMKNINKFYDDFHVLKGINFSVKKGEIVVICGPSGSGKSTLIRCINGLEEIDEGTIIVDEMDIYKSKKNLKTIRSEVGMVFQHFNLFPHLTILENITLAQNLVKKRSVKEAKQIAHDLLEKVKLSHKADSYPSDLSGGQKQRVALARTLMQDANLILMDEPFAALDAITKIQLQDLTCHLLKDKTVVLVTHDPQEAIKLANHIYILKNQPVILEKVASLEGTLPHQLSNEKLWNLQEELISKLQGSDI